MNGAQKGCAPVPLRQSAAWGNGPVLNLRRLLMHWFFFWVSMLSVKAWDDKNGVPPSSPWEKTGGAGVPLQHRGGSQGGLGSPRGPRGAAAL